MTEYQGGFRKLIVWRNSYSLRSLIYKISKRFPKIEFRRVSQMRDAARSVKQNIQEGYKRGTAGEYIQFLNISRGSLGELSGDIEDCREDRLITEDEYKKLDELCGKTDYLLTRQIQAILKMQREGTWRTFRDNP